MLHLIGGTKKKADKLPHGVSKEDRLDYFLSSFLWQTCENEIHRNIPILPTLEYHTCLHYGNKAENRKSALTPSSKK